MLMKFIVLKSKSTMTNMMNKNKNNLKLKRLTTCNKKRKMKTKKRMTIKTRQVKKKRKILDLNSQLNTMQRLQQQLRSLTRTLVVMEKFREYMLMAKRKSFLTTV